MEEITSFMLCDSTRMVQTPSGSEMQIVNPTVTLMPAFIPCIFSFAISVGIRGIKLENDNFVSVTIESPAGEVIHEINRSPLPRNLGNAEGVPIEEAGFLMNLDVRNLELHEEGRYKFKLNLNDAPAFYHDIPVYAKKKK